MSEATETRELSRSDIVVQTGAEKPGRIGVVRWIHRWGKGEVRIQWSTRRHVLPKVIMTDYTGSEDEEPYAYVQKGSRCSGSCSFATVRKYQLRRLPFEAVKKARREMKLARTDDELTWGEQWEIVDAIREGLLHEAEDVELPELR